MAQKLLEIKLVFDTTEGAKFATVTSNMSASVDKVTQATISLSTIEKERLALVDKQIAAETRLNNSYENNRAAVANNERTSNQAIYNITRQTETYNKVIDATKDKIIALTQAQAMASNLGLGSGKSADDSAARAVRQAELLAERNARAAAESISASTLTAASGGSLGGYTASGSANARTEAARIAATALVETERETNARLLANFQTYDQRARDLYAIHNGARIRAEQQANAQMAALHTEALEMNRARTLAASSTNEHTNAVNQNSTALAANVTQHQSLLVRIAEVMGAYKLLNVTLQYTKQALIDIPKAGLEQQVTESSLLGIFGSEKTQQNLAFLQEVADKAGQSLVVLEQAYRRYAPSAVLAGVSQKAVNKSFQEFAEVGTILHLPEEKINSLFLALDQMFAKGVVQSEEVKKQLGNVLPGAVEAFAQSMGKTPAAFMESMKKNEVIAREAVPIFSAHYRKIFGGPDDSVFTLIQDRLQSNLNRLQTAYTLMDRAIFADTRDTMNDIVKVAAEMVSAVGTNIKGIIQAVEVLSAVIMARLVGTAIKAAIINFGVLAAAASRALIMVTGLAAPELAVAAAVAYTTAKIVGLGIAYDKVIGFTVTFHEKSYGLVNFLTSMFDVAMNNVYSVTNKIGAAFDYVANKLSFMQPIFEKMYEVFVAIGKIVPDFGLKKAFEDTAVRAAIKDQRDLINSFEDTKKTVKDLDKAIAEGKLNAIDTGEGFSKADLASETQANIEEAKRKMLLIAEAEHSVIPDEDPLGMSNSAISKALAKQQALLTQSNADIDNAGKIKIALLEKQKAAVEQSMISVGGKVATPEIQGKQQVHDIELKIFNITKETTRAKEMATLAVEKENATLQSNALLLTKNKEAIYAAVRWQETKTKSDTDESTGAKGTFGGRGASAVSGSSTDKSRGSMQITEAAWVATGREAKEFADAGMVELAKAGRQYLDQMLLRFKDAEISLAAYNQGTGAVTNIYKKAGVNVGETDPEELAKVKANLTPLMLKYVKETMSTIPVQKGDIAAITQQTALNKLKADESVLDIQIAQKKEKFNNDNIVYLDQYRKKVEGLKADVLISKGNVAEGETLKINLKYEQMRAEYTKDGNTEALKYLDILQQSEVSSKLVAIAEEHLRNVTQEVAMLENSINVARQAGLITQSDAATALIAAKQKEYDATAKVSNLLKEQEANGINQKDNLEKINVLEAQRAQHLKSSTQLQTSVISTGDKTGYATAVGGHLANQENIVKNRDYDIANFQNDPTLSAEKNAAAKKAITDKANKAELSSNIQMYAGIAQAGADAMHGITSAMIKMYGARSTQARLAFAAEKAFNIAACIMNTATGIMKAYDLPAPYSAIMATLVGVTGAVQLATIAATPMPQAHAGLTNVPADQTYLLSAGERVLAPQQNKDLTQALAGGGTLGKQQAPQVNVKVNNILDPSVVGDYMDTPQGERMIVNIMRKNRVA